MQKKRDSRVIVVTGASAGVGRAIVREFAAPGIKIGLIARGRDGLEAARREVLEAGGQALALPLDVADPEAVEQAAQSIEEQFGPIDVWVNNAMVSVFSPVKNMTPDEYRRVTDVTYLGYVYGTLAALKRMLPRDHGVIVQVGSALAYRSIPLQSAYCGAKAAIAGFTESLRTELIHDQSQVKVTLVHLPALNTPQFGWVRSRLPNRAQPVPPIFQPEVAARAIVYAVEHPKKEHWLGFSTSKAIIGDKLAAAYADRYLAKHGYEMQQTDEPEVAGRKDNLYDPLPGDWGAHGDFDDRAKKQSWQWKAKKNKWLLGALGIAAGLLFTSRAAARTAAPNARKEGVAQAPQIIPQSP